MNQLRRSKMLIYVRIANLLHFYSPGDICFELGVTHVIAIFLFNGIVSSLELKFSNSICARSKTRAKSRKNVFCSFSSHISKSISFTRKFQSGKKFCNKMLNEKTIVNLQQLLKFKKNVKKFIVFLQTFCEIFKYQQDPHTLPNKT